MSERCEITGLSPEDVNLFANLHSHIVGKLELSTPSKESLASYDKPLGNTVNNHKFNTGDLDRKSVV
jgi:hypothetical protein